ncbi:THAP domain-containing protein 6-like [Symphorus nematophorus]
MPEYCAAVGCFNQRGPKTKGRGITFHKFPKDKDRRKAWVTALRRKKFEPSRHSVVCSCHFKSEDFDMTGQTTRIKEGVTPSIFVFSLYRKVPNPRTSRTSQKAAAPAPLPSAPSAPPAPSAPSAPATPATAHATAPAPPAPPATESYHKVHVRLSGNLEESDHQYALDPVKAKQKLIQAQRRIEELQRDLRNAKDRERRHKKIVKSLLRDLKQKNLLTKELQKEIDLYNEWETGQNNSHGHQEAGSG